MKTPKELANEIRHGLAWYQHEFRQDTGRDYLETVIENIIKEAIKEYKQYAKIKPAKRRRIGRPKKR